MRRNSVICRSAMAFKNYSYPYGLLINGEGKRFLDEGADFRNYTYAKYGREILNQPGQFAWQVFDSKTTELLRDEYRIKQTTRVVADDLVTLANQMDGVNAEVFLSTIQEFNASIGDEYPFNPATKDNRRTHGLAIPKSNWATRIDAPPFVAYGVTCGITFTFGGLRIDTEARVLDEADIPIHGLYAAGEIVGGLFYFNYPGGRGLCAGAVFGRAAGRNAADKTL